MKATPEKRPLTAKQQAFVREYLIDLNATQAAIRAGYSERNADKIGSELLGKTGVADAIAGAMKAREVRTEITQDYVLSVIRDTVERCRQAKPVLMRDGKPVMVETPDGDTAPVYDFDSMAVLKGAELLGRHLKMFTDKVEHSGKVDQLSDAEIDAKIATLLQGIKAGNGSA